ncbi:MAG: hypothetical protein ACI4JS_04285 [Oscillospiraceae bacterium]
MKKKTLLTVAAIFAAMTMLAGCNNAENSAQSGQSSQSDTTQESSTPESSVDSSDASVESSTSTESTTNSEPDTPAEEKPVSASELGLKDGKYYVDVTLEGGSGKTKVKSPAEMEVFEGNAYVTIEFSSSNYTYIKINGIEIPKDNDEGNSQFFTLVRFDYHMPVIANTTAMGNPHEIEYTMYFDSKTIVKR